MISSKMSSLSELPLRSSELMVAAACSQRSSFSSLSGSGWKEVMLDPQKSSLAECKQDPVVLSPQIKIQNTTNSSEVALRSNFTHNLPLRVNIILAFNQHTQVSPGSELYALLCFFSPQIMFVKFNKLIFVITYN